VDIFIPAHPAVRVATAGWSIESKCIDEFPLGGTHLERYGRRLNSVELNSSFYRPHRHVTYERWATTTPKTFRFSVKMPKSITHEHGLVSCEDILKRFFDQVSGLGEKLEVLLVQLPPKSVFESVIFEHFMDELCRHTKAMIAFEPRHSSWFTDEVDNRMSNRRVARVAADPALILRGGEPGGWNGLAYYRWHGAPRVYYSEYGPERLDAAAKTLTANTAAKQTIWFVFDNTAAGAAIGNALTLATKVNSAG
jgi:uncharacterized protein YecE (DUF72 family)